MSNGDLGYIAVRHFNHICHHVSSFVRLCNCSVCILCIENNFLTKENPQGLNVTKGSLMSCESNVHAGFEYWILSCGYVLVVYIRMWCV